MNEDTKLAVSCIILTLNEEPNLAAVISSLAPAEQVMIVDCGSTDGTVPLARALGAEVTQNVWPGYAKQRNWALDHANLRHDWVLFIDADERMTMEGWAEIGPFLTDPANSRAADFRRAVHLFGKELRHGGFNTARVTRLLHRGSCRFLERPVHEHAIVNGRTHSMTVPITHDDRKPFSEWLDRHNRYSSLEAEARLYGSLTEAPGGSRGLKQWIRTNIWHWLPARPALFFLYIYVLRLGFLDGLAGLRIAAFYGFQEMSVQIKLEELKARPR